MTSLGEVATSTSLGIPRGSMAQADATSISPSSKPIPAACNSRFESSRLGIFGAIVI